MSKLESYRTEKLSVSGRVTLTAMLVSAALMLPQVFHLAGGPAAGGIFLPMHLPVMLAGLLLGARSGFICGILSPVAGFLLLGMPGLARLPFMVAELGAYGLASGLLSRVRLNGTLKVLLVQLAGRLASGAALLLAVRLLGRDVPFAASFWAALVTGIPGMLIQLAAIPAVMNIYGKMRVSAYGKHGTVKKTIVR